MIYGGVPQHTTDESHGQQQDEMRFSLEGPITTPKPTAKVRLQGFMGSTYGTYSLESVLLGHRILSAQAHGDITVEGRLRNHHIPSKDA